MASDLHPDLRPPPTSLGTPQRALAVGAHPDDIEFGAGGTLARWATAGCRVTMLVVTDGSKGTWHRDADPAGLAAVRRREQAAAARELGAAEVEHLDLVDGELEYSMELRGELCARVRIAKPDVVVTHDPWRRYDMHPDHRVTGLAVVDGVIAARDHLFYTDQGLEPHRPAALLLWSPDEADHYEPIDVERKIGALLRHSSQAATTMGDAGSDENQRRAFARLVRDQARAWGADAGMEMAEPFKRLTP